MTNYDRNTSYEMKYNTFFGLIFKAFEFIAEQLMKKFNNNLTVVVAFILIFEIIYAKKLIDR